jgi:hypothetical protein
LADSQPFSVTKLLAGLGGALLIASFFLPIVNANQADGAPGVNELRRHIASAPDADLVRPLIDPALKSLEAFAASPNLMHLTTVAGAAGDLLNTAADAGADDAAEMRKMAGILGWVRKGLWLLPLVGLVQLVLPAISRLRGYAGFLGLVARFLFGWLFLLIALVPIIGVEERQQAMLGSAVWTLLVGAALMVIASLFGGNRRNWWGVLLVDIGLIALTVFAISTFGAGR